MVSPEVSPEVITDTMGAELNFDNYGMADVLACLQKFQIEGEEWLLKSGKPTAGDIADAIDHSGKPAVIGVALSGGSKHCLAIVPTPATEVDLYIKTYGGAHKDYAYTITDGLICDTYGSAPMSRDGLANYLQSFPPAVDKWICCKPKS